MADEQTDARFDGCFLDDECDDTLCTDHGEDR